jgi:ubiquinone/menaquinone biosynthesis C-methylase UbiE
MGWNQVYAQSGRSPLPPQESMPEIVDLFHEKDVKKVLDLGCGTGRHVVYLAERGFQVSGMDESPAGIKLAGEWLQEQNLKADLVIASMFGALPYANSYFDALISNRVINHGKIADIRRAITEIQRVLKPHGLIFIEVRKPAAPFRPDRKYEWADIIAPRTLKYSSGLEKGVTHYQFNKTILLDEFRNFKILHFWVDSTGENYCFTAELKS